MDRQAKYLSYVTVIFAQALLLYSLFNKSVAIDGDIVSYLEIIKGNYNEGDSFEPVSLFIFKLIGLLPSGLHFSVLLCFCIVLAMAETWIVFKRTNGSLLWLVFFTFCVVPFAHAINIRTGFGTIFITVFSNHVVALFLVPFFHTSFLPLLVGVKVKFSMLTIAIISLATFSIGILLYFMIYNKILTYYGYYGQGESIVGVVVELLMLGSFAWLLLRKYEIHSNILWPRILMILFFISTISIPISIISSRFVTLIYFVFVLIRINVQPAKLDNQQWLLRDVMFYALFSGLILFRLYRVLTMFGYV